MLEKNEKKMYFDAHFHYYDCVKKDAFSMIEYWKGCSCAHSVEEWEFQKEAGENIKKSFGIHPQTITDSFDRKYMLDFLEKLLQSRDICCVGETGFDFYSEEYKRYALLQEEVFLEQISLCIDYSVPVVIHCRKANEKLFEYSSELKKLPAVLFHSFMGTSAEAFSLLKRNINGYFSFGKQMMNANKKVVSCVKELPLENLLLETDSPYQFLKGESKTFLNDIKTVYDEAIRIRNDSTGEFYSQVEKNFYNLYESHITKD